jgi:hypothetical protein
LTKSIKPGTQAPLNWCCSTNKTNGIVVFGHHKWPTPSGPEGQQE